MFLIFDTETTGFPKSFNAPFTDTDNWPRIVQLAWQIHDETGKLVENFDYVIKPEGFTIPFNAQKIHGISTEIAEKEGVDLSFALEEFEKGLAKSTIISGHNIKGFDLPVMLCEYFRKDINTTLSDKKLVDTIENGTTYCALPGGRGGGFKYPKLGELYQKLFNENFSEAHNAAADVNANARAFLEMVRKKIIPANEVLFSAEQIQHFLDTNPEPFAVFDIKIRTQVEGPKEEKSIEITSEKVDSQFHHPFYFNFHNHSTYSILHSAIQPADLIEKAIQEKMPAVGMTDFGNLMGSFHFLNAAEKLNDKYAEERADFTPIIPIVGLEMYLSETYEQQKFTKDAPDKRYPQVFLAKNKNGYKNLSKISSIGFTEGFYSGVPRVSKAVVEKYKEDLVATTGSIHSEIPSLILNIGEDQAEEVLLWYKEVFKDDFYIELQNHLLETERALNEVLLRFSAKHNIKILPQNECFYIEQNTAEVQDILSCIKDGEKKNVPIGRGFGFRNGLTNQEYFFKNSAEIQALFPEQEDLFVHFEDLLKKFETYSLSRDILLPKFDIPTQFLDETDKEDAGKRGENNYLRHLTYEGAKKRYGEITPEIEERLDFELKTIENTGYPGYFLIVQDITNSAKEMGVNVGPGRGSAAGSVVAYCINITNVDPIKYDLLFERFLNPDRISMPDIDIDFDDRGRDKIINWVVEKYGKNQVAQIITYGKLAGRSAIRDTGRVLELPLFETDILSKKLPSTLNLTKIAHLDEKELRKKVNSDEIDNVNYIKNLLDENSAIGKVVQNAVKLEGSIRNTGIHACGVIITPEDISNLIPVSIAKDSDFWVSQFDNSVVEDAGLLKMDFLGLRTLTIINDALEIIEQKTGKKLDPDEFPLDDELTYENIFKPGNTIGIFQYESAGMQKHLKALQPDKFDDLIAMNALYRPGPIQYIPNFIARKLGTETIEYDLPVMEENLSDTYGITVYQEQVMLLSQKIANFTKGEADTLRKAMGKKQKYILDKMFPKFIEGGTQNNHPEEKLQKIWKDWEAFAEYAFNKSHSTCYAMVAFHTAYLKAHYPAEFMASLLSNNLNNLKTLSFFMDECRKMGIEVLGPSVNESRYKFFVNEEGNIRFGLGAIRGIGEHSVNAITEERENGNYTSIIDFVERIDLKNVNKKTMEGLALSGAFDELDSYSRATYFHLDSSNDRTTLENLLSYGNSFQDSKNQSQNSLFGDLDGAFEMLKPTINPIEEWNTLHKLKQEKEVIGIYISSHPLDEYKYELALLQNKNIDEVAENLQPFVNQEITVCGMINKVDKRVTKDGRSEYAVFELEDYTGTNTFTLKGDLFLKNSFLLEPNRFVYLKFLVKEFNDQSHIYTQVTQIDLLKNILDQLTKKLVLKINLKDINPELIEQLNQLTEANPGKKKLEIFIEDTENDQMLELTSTTKRISICKELLNVIDENESVKYRLN